MIFRRLFLLGPLLFAAPSRLFAMASSGFSNEAIDPRALGQYNCVTAQADDASAIYFNPAGLTQIHGWNLSASDTMFDINTRHTSPQGQRTTADTNLLHAPSVFLVHGMPERDIAYGVGVFSPFGLETEWSGDSFARYSATLSRLNIAMITPAFAYRISSEWQVGVGLDVAMATDVDLRKKVDVSAINGVASPDGDSRQQATGHGIGANVGVRFVPNTRHTIGLTYRSPISMPLEGTQRMTGLSGAAAFVFGGTEYKVDSKAHITLPGSVVGGYAFHVTPQWTVESDLQWTDWTSIDTFHVTFDEPDATRQSILNAGVDPLHRDWQAAWAWGVGTHYDIDEKWTVRGGAGYAWGTVPESSFEPALPDADRFECTAGFTRQLTRSTAFHFAYNGVFFHDRTITNSVDGGRINGLYETVIHAYSLGIEQRF